MAMPIQPLSKLKRSNIFGLKGGHEPVNRHPYPDYVDSLARHEDEWLVEFLRLPADRFASANDSNAKTNSNIFILDVIPSTAPELTVMLSAGKDQPAPSRLFELLDDVPKDCSFRVVILQHEGHSSCINTASMNFIGQKYMVDPRFFELHFSFFNDEVVDLDEETRLRGNLKHSKPCPPYLLPSETKFLQIKVGTDCHLTTTMIELSGLKLAIVLGYSGEREKMPNAAFHIPCTMVTSLLSQDYLCPNFSLLDLCCDYIRSSIRLVAKDCFENTWISSHQFNSDIANVSKVSEHHRVNQTNQKCLAFSQESVARYVAYQNNATKMKWASILHDYDAVATRTHRLGEELQTRLQIMLNSTAIEEARRGLGQADSIKKLTVVALVFMPLSFASSFLGMNVKEMDPKNVGIQYFFLVAASSTLLAYLTSASIPPSKRAFNTFKQRYLRRHGLQQHLPVPDVPIATLALFLLKEMFRYLLYLMREPWERVRDDIEQETGILRSDVTRGQVWKRIFLVAFNYVREHFLKIVIRKPAEASNS